MSYLKKIEYEMIPEHSFNVLRNCAGCGVKSVFVNTKKFRVNANGSRLDVWLIYQCGKCRHTFNLAVYERCQVSTIREAEYRKFMENDEQLAELYGRSMALFQKNRAQIDPASISYRMVRKEDTIDADKNRIPQETLLAVHNPHGLKVRPEKQLAGILGWSVSKVKKLLEQGELQLIVSSPRYLEVSVKSAELDKTAQTGREK